MDSCGIADRDGGLDEEKIKFERLFYRILCEHTEQLMPLVYTPVVGEACINYSRIFHRSRGMYITVHDSGQISNILANWPEKDIKVNHNYDHLN